MSDATPRRRSRRALAVRMIVMLLIMGVVFGGIYAFQAFKAGAIKKFLATQSNPPQTVSTVEAKVQDWQPELAAVGSLRAVHGADLSFEVAGIVSEIDFQSGADVAAGAVLAKLRSEDDAAKLRSLQAVADLARITLERDQRQFKAQAVSQAQIDTDAANLKNAEAQVAQQQAILAKSELHAPFAGRLGIRAVDQGQFLPAGTVVVTLQSLDPIYIDFYLPQAAVERAKVGQKVAVAVDAYPKDSFSGEISAVNPKVDTANRNVQLRGTLKNADGRLLPGMFARATVPTGSPQQLLTLPQTAITYNPYGNTVYLVEQQGNGSNGAPQLVARQTFVATGETRGDQVAVLSGIKEGDTVVSAGQVKLRNGSLLAINNDIQPTAEANPSPPNQ